MTMQETNSGPTLCWAPSRRGWRASGRDAVGYHQANLPKRITEDQRTLAEEWTRNWWNAVTRNRDLGRSDRRTLTAGLTMSVSKLAARWVSGRPKAGGWKELWVDPSPVAAIDPEKLTVPDMVKWIDWALTTGRAPFTIRNALAQYRAMFRDARGRGWIERGDDPTRDPYLTKHAGGWKPKVAEIVHLKPGEVTTLLASTPDSGRRVLYAMAIATGMRSGELAGAKVGDVRLDVPIPYVRIDRQLLRAMAWRSPEFGPPKRGSTRVIPLHPLLVPLIADLTRGRASDAALFPNSRGEHWECCSARRLREDLVACGIPAKTARGNALTFHALRRTFLTLLYAEGAPEEVLRQLAGHAARSVTFGSYVGARLEPLKRVIDLLPVLGSPRGTGSGT